MLKAYTKAVPEKVVSIVPLLSSEFPHWLTTQSEYIQNWLKSSGFSIETTSYALIPDSTGQLSMVILILEKLNDQSAYAALVRQLPSQIYQIESTAMEANDYNSAALGWGLGQYYFTRYKKLSAQNPKLLITSHYDPNTFDPMVNATYLIRDLINTPAEDLGPEALARAGLNLGHSFGAMVVQTTGKDLLTKNYSAIYTVGRGSHRAPMLIDLTWGDSRHPRLTLIGKGVCFDTGGLDLKSAKGMQLMKKDMAGAAHVLGLAHLIMNEKLPVRLRVIIPAVENSIGGNAYRPGDVIKIRNQTTVEIGNTDAEGRLVLAEAMTEAVLEKPDLIIDIASLTGAARVALGTDVPVFFSNEESIASELIAACNDSQELIWRLPLYQPYRSYLNSPIAEINNSSSSEYGGAITAALFLETFINNNKWIHFDIMGWNTAENRGRPVGGEAMGLRTLFKFLQKRYGK